MGRALQDGLDEDVCYAITVKKEFWDLPGGATEQLCSKKALRQCFTMPAAEPQFTLQMWLTRRCPVASRTGVLQSTWGKGVVTARLERARDLGTGILGL